MVKRFVTEANSDTCPLSVKIVLISVIFFNSIKEKNRSIWYSIFLRNLPDGLISFYYSYTQLLFVSIYDHTKSNPEFKLYVFLYK